MKTTTWRIRIHLWTWGMIILFFAFNVSHAEDTSEPSESGIAMKEIPVEFKNGGVHLAGNLLLPEMESPAPGIIFVQGAGNRPSRRLREIAEHFATSGIAALIYDKRGTGRSGGTYESSAPYENLVNDVLAGINLLKTRPEIDKSRIGIWGLSQGAYISAEAASRSSDIQFVLVVGASVADGMLTFYRNNLFRRYGLSDKLRDIAEKNYVIEQDLRITMKDGVSTSSFIPRKFPSPENFLHPAWIRVHQPVLALWGELDQHVQVSESIAGLKNSLAHAGNDQWTMIILPGTNHSLGQSSSGDLHRPWNGFTPGALNRMSDWAHRVITDRQQIERTYQEGTAEPSGILSQLNHYQNLRWFGNGIVQSVLFILFFLSFVTHTIRWGFGLIQKSTPDSQLIKFKRALCGFNLVVLAGFVVVVISVINQIFPSCPHILMYLPLLGTISILATLAFLWFQIKHGNSDEVPLGNRLPGIVDTLGLALFIPYLIYWNVVGIHF